MTETEAARAKLNELKDATLTLSSLCREEAPRESDLRRNLATLQTKEQEMQDRWQYLEPGKRDAYLGEMEAIQRRAMKQVREANPNIRTLEDATGILIPVRNVVMTRSKRKRIDADDGAADVTMQEEPRQEEICSGPTTNGNSSRAANLVDESRDSINGNKTPLAGQEVDNDVFYEAGSGGDNGTASASSSSESELEAGGKNRARKDDPRDRSLPRDRPIDKGKDKQTSRKSKSPDKVDRDRGPSESGRHERPSKARSSGRKSRSRSRSRNREKKSKRRSKSRDGPRKEEDRSAPKSDRVPNPDAVGAVGRALIVLPARSTKEAASLAANHDPAATTGPLRGSITPIPLALIAPVVGTAIVHAPQIGTSTKASRISTLNPIRATLTPGTKGFTTHAKASLGSFPRILSKTLAT